MNLRSFYPFKVHIFWGGHKNMMKPQNFLKINLDLRNCDLRKNLDLRKIVATTKILVHKLFDLRKIF